MWHCIKIQIQFLLTLVVVTVTLVQWLPALVMQDEDVSVSAHFSLMLNLQIGLVMLCVVSAVPLLFVALKNF